MDKAREKYRVYHLHVRQGSNGRKQSVIDGWAQLMGDSLVMVDDHRDIPKIIADIVSKQATKAAVPQANKPSGEAEPPTEEEML